MLQWLRAASNILFLIILWCDFSISYLTFVKVSKRQNVKKKSDLNRTVEGHKPYKRPKLERQKEFKFFFLLINQDKKIRLLFLLPSYNIQCNTMEVFNVLAARLAVLLVTGVSRSPCSFRSLDWALHFMSSSLDVVGDQPEVLLVEGLACRMSSGNVNLNVVVRPGFPRHLLLTFNPFNSFVLQWCKVGPVCSRWCGVFCVGRTPGLAWVPNNT